MLFLSGKVNSQIPCFPCAVATLNKVFHEFKKLNSDVAKHYSKNKELVKPKPSEKPHKTTGSLEVKHHGIKKRRPQNHKFFCPVCKQIFDLRCEVNLHVSQKHPTFKYKCRYCGKMYIIYASKYKHQNSHSPLKHVCKLCGKKFQFKKNLTVHDRTHTGVGLLRCPHCQQLYTMKCAMDYHFKVHMDQQVDFNQCSLSTNIYGNILGEHMGEGGFHPVGLSIVGCQRCSGIIKMPKV